MARADVVVIGAGLAGLSAAIGLAEAGATVEVVARGHAATHWTSGGFDIAAPRDAATSAEGIDRLARLRGHPYAALRRNVPGALAWLRGVLADEGLEFAGALDDPLRAIPTAIGGTRRAAILPTAQAAALAPWQPGERLIVCGPAGFKDFWPDAIVASLRRPAVWVGDNASDSGPARIDAVVVELPGVTDLRNLNALDLAGLFDNPRWRSAAYDTMARAIERAGGHRGAGRIAFPAVLGLQDHAAAFDDAFRFLSQPLFEVPLVSPSIPGVRLYNALRAALRRRGGRMVIGEPVASVATEGGRVTSVAMTAAVRERVIRTNGLVLATGGIAGGGLFGRADGRLIEPILDLPVEAPPAERWLADNAFDPAGHPLEAAGIRTDGNLRPVDAKGKVVLENVVVVGSMLAGQRYLVERCGDGVAIASGQRAAATLGAEKKRRAGSATRRRGDSPTTRRQRAGVRR